MHARCSRPLYLELLPEAGLGLCPAWTEETWACYWTFLRFPALRKDTLKVPPELCGWASCLHEATETAPVRMTNKVCAESSNNSSMLNPIALPVEFDRLTVLRAGRSTPDRGNCKSKSPVLGTSLMGSRHRKKAWCGWAQSWEGRGPPEWSFPTGHDTQVPRVGFYHCDYEELSSAKYERDKTGEEMERRPQTWSSFLSGWVSRLHRWLDKRACKPFLDGQCVVIACSCPIHFLGENCIL